MASSLKFAKGKIYGVLRARVIADNGEDHSHRTDESHYNLLSIDNEQNEIVEPISNQYRYSITSMCKC